MAQAIRILTDPTRDEMLTALAGADEFEVEAAIYWFAADWHGGQSSNLYSALSTSRYRPGMAVEFADVLEGFSRGQARISARGDSGLCLISAGTGTGKGDGWIGAEGQALALSSKGVVKGPASMTILRDPQRKS